MAQTLQYLATQWSQASQNIVDNLTKDKGILATMEIGFSNQGLSHKYNRVITLPTASVRSVNGSVVPTTSQYELLNLDLKEIMTIEQVDSTLAKMDRGGVSAYFQKQLPNHIEGVAQSASTTLVYGIDPTFGNGDGFLGFHQYAKANSKVIQLSGTTGSRTSIFAVHWKPEVNQFVIPEGVMTSGDLVLVTVMNNGEPRTVVVNTTTGAVKPVYEVMYQMMGALQIGSNYGVSAITQIDSSHKPTASQVDQAIDYVKGANDGMTYLYMNRTARRYLQELKATKFFSQVDTNMNTVLDFWNGIPVVIDDSILDTETTVLD